MNEKLSDEQIQKWRSEIKAIDEAGNYEPEFGHFTNPEMQKALNTIEALQAQVAGLRDELFEACKSFRVIEYKTPSDTLERHYEIATYAANRMKPIYDNTQATAEAFIAKERKDEREKTIRECAELAYAKTKEEDNFRLRDILLTLLTKEKD